MVLQIILHLFTDFNLYCILYINYKSCLREHIAGKLCVEF